MEKIKSYFNKERKNIFFITFFTCMIVHFQLYALMITGADNLIFNVYHQANIWEVMLLRFGLCIMQAIKGGVVSPILASLISSILLGITVLLAIDTLDIKNKYFKYLIAVLFAVAPNISATFTFFYCSDAYIMGMFLATLSVYLVRKYGDKKCTILLSSLLLAFSISMYQTYLSVTMCLCMFTLIIDALNKKDAKQILKNLVRYICMGVIGVILYYIIAHLVLLISKLPIANYSGASQIGLSTLLNINKLLPESYQSFFNYFFNDKMIPNTIWGTNIFYTIIFAVILIAMIYLIIKNKPKFSNIILTLIFVALLPLCFGIIEIIVPDVDIHILMACSMIFIFLLFFKILEMLPKINLAKICNYTVVICSLAIVWIYTWQDNASYLAMKLTQDQAISAIGRIVTRIEELDGYTIDMPVVFIGNFESPDYLNKDNANVDTNKIYERSWGFIADWPVVWWGNQDSWRKLLYECEGVNMNIVGEEECQEVLQTDEYKEMGQYPEKDSIKIIDGTVVVRLYK